MADRIFRALQLRRGRFLRAHPDSICTKKLINVMKGLSAVQCTRTNICTQVLAKSLYKYICILNEFQAFMENKSQFAHSNSRQGFNSDFVSN